MMHGAYNVKAEILIFYGFETWSASLSKDRRLKVFQRVVLINVFDPKRKAVEEVKQRIA